MMKKIILLGLVFLGVLVALAWPVGSTAEAATVDRVVVPGEKIIPAATREDSAGGNSQVLESQSRERSVAPDVPGQKPPDTPEIRPGGALLPFPGVKSFAQAMKQAQEVAPGVKYYTLEGRNWQGKPLRGNVIEINPGQPLLEIRLVLGGDALGKKETVSSMATRYGAVGAINGGFFDSSTGQPIGQLVQDGRLLTKWDILRTSIGLAGNNQVLFGYFSPQVRIQMGEGGGTLEVQGMNSHPVENGITLYTPDWGISTRTSSDCIDVAVSRDKKGDEFVTTISSGNSMIPPNGYVISFHGEKVDIARSLSAGMQIRLTLDYGFHWKGLKHLVTGGPLLVDQGQPVLQGILEGFRGSVLDTVPRSAIGLDKKGHILLVQVDGRQDDWSAGITLEELAYLMCDLGAVKAAALDGGGSSIIWVKGKVVSRPSEGKERPVANAFLVLHQIPVYLDDSRLFFDVPPVLERGRILVPMRRIFEVFQASVDWDQETKTVTATRGDLKIILTVGKSETMINERKYLLDVPAQVVEGRTMVPLRFVSEALGAEVTWQSRPPAVFIITRSAQGFS